MPDLTRRLIFKKLNGVHMSLSGLENVYGDGIKWHDVACHHEKPIVCEDTEGHLNFARQTFPQIKSPGVRLVRRRKNLTK